MASAALSARKARARARACAAGAGQQPASLAAFWLIETSMAERWLLKASGRERQSADCVSRRRHRHYAWRSARKLAPLLPGEAGASLGPAECVGKSPGERACAAAATPPASTRAACPARAMLLAGGATGRPSTSPARSKRSQRARCGALTNTRSHIHKFVRSCVRLGGRACERVRSSVRASMPLNQMSLRPPWNDKRKISRLRRGVIRFKKL